MTAHKAEAEGGLFGWNGLVNVQENWRDLVIAEAQVHATLYLADQQLIANLITYVREIDDSGQTVQAITPLIREGLGLS